MKIPRLNRIKDIGGQRFGRLLALWIAGRRLSGSKNIVVWSGQCDCGNVVTFELGNLHGGDKKSCGCLERENRIKHGDCPRGKRTAEYYAYTDARQRCNNPNVKNFKWYGKRGIQFKFESFPEFISHIGRKPSPRLTLERINNNGHYEAGNVRWATWKEQAQNKRPRQRWSH